MYNHLNFEELAPHNFHRICNEPEAKAEQYEFRQMHDLQRLLRQSRQSEAPHEQVWAIQAKGTAFEEIQVANQ